MSQTQIAQTATEAAYDSYVLRNYGRPAITLARGEGCRVWDDSGRRYLDFASGIAVNAVGHCHPRWVKAVSEQAATLVHVSNLYRNPLQGELAKRLVAHAGPRRDLVYALVGAADRSRLDANLYVAVAHARLRLIVCKLQPVFGEAQFFECLHILSWFEVLFILSIYFMISDAARRRRSITAAPSPASPMPSTTIVSGPEASSARNAR